MKHCFNKPISAILVGCTAFILFSTVLSNTTFAAVKQKLVHTTVAKKNVEPVGTSRCLRDDIRKLYTVATKHMETDIAKKGAGFETATKVYRDDIATIWAAMHEPYCGYGSRGVGAVIRSFNKSVIKAQLRFQNAVKKIEKTMAVK